MADKNKIKPSSLIPQEKIANRILFIRGQKVIIDSDIAGLYGVETKVLNQAVRRNNERFPEDFMFVLTKKEKSELVTNCDRFGALKHSAVFPHAFTEQGVAMLASVLRSKRAVEMSILIVRTFVRLRNLLQNNEELLRRIQALECDMDTNKQTIIDIYEVVEQLLSIDQDGSEKDPEPMGFRID
ncbi:ORF6N domain-containing protein [Candidatus Dojkabacteria bacterium]|nr:ORF6N domain-containing protein [Candidatus Dojkabacteria bacterium]